MAGAISLSGNGSLSAQNQFIGNSATGTVAQSGGVNSVGSALYLGYFAGSSGTYSLGGNGQLSANGADLGYSGTGTFTQSGGVSSIGNALILGANAGGNGTYAQWGGVNSVSNVAPTRQQWQRHLQPQRQRPVVRKQ